MKTKIIKIANKIAKGGKNIIFTGAGISTESGISDFRSKGGIWDRYQPVYYDEFMSSKKARIKYWQQKTELYPELVKAKPNKGHKAVATLYEKGVIDAVITQNIDGLHQKSGIPDDKVLELHGNNLRVRCMGCGKLSPLDEAHQRIESGDTAPECECGGYLKPDTISFGQSLPEHEMAKAAILSRECDFFMVIGSTLLVQPAAGFPNIAKENGAFLVIINMSETPLDSVCDVLIQEKAGRVLSEIDKLVVKSGSI